MFPVQITIRNIPASAALENHIRLKVQKLNKFYDRIMRCHVTIEVPQKHKHRGKLFNARIDVMVPGKELVVTHKTNEDVYIAIRDALAAIGRQLEEHGRKRHGRVKSHNHIMHGHVVRLIAKEGYGFIEGMDGNEYYFSLTNVAFPSFENLCVGDSVHYTPETQSEGFQALHIIRERHQESIY